MFPLSKIFKSTVNGLKPTFISQLSKSILTFSFVITLIISFLYLLPLQNNQTEAQSLPNSNTGHLNANSIVQWTGTTGTIWTTPTNVQTSNDLRAVTSNFQEDDAEVNSRWIILTNFGISIPDNATVFGVEANLEGYKTGTSSIPKLRLVVGGAGQSVSEKPGSELETSETTQTLGSNTDRWNNTLTPAIVNSSNFGITFRQVQKNSQSFIDHVSINVHYYDPTPLGCDESLCTPWTDNFCGPHTGVFVTCSSTETYRTRDCSAPSSTCAYENCVSDPLCGAPLPPPVQQPDLVVSSGPSISGSLQPGGAVTLSATVQNTGSGNATSSSFTSFELLRASSGTVVAAAPSQSTPTLSSGASQTLNTAWTLPASLTPDTYRLRACADGLGHVTESYEGNNCRSGNAFLVQPAPPLPAPPPLPTTCTDTDGDSFNPLTVSFEDLNISTQGTCSDSEGTVATDRSAPGNWLLEFFCTSEATTVAPAGVCWPQSGVCPPGTTSDNGECVGNILPQPLPPPPLPEGPDCSIGDPAQLSDIVCVLERIISLLAPAAGLAFFVMLLFGGFRFVTSGGDPKSVAQARTILTFAIIGIILVISVWLVLLLVKSITNVDVTTVSFPTGP